MTADSALKAPAVPITDLGQRLLWIAGRKASRTLARSARDLGLPASGRGYVIRVDRRYRSLLSPHSENAAEFQIDNYHVCTHGDHWSGSGWRVSAEEIPLHARAMSTPTLMTWPEPETWHLWHQLAESTQLEAALDTLLLFARRGHWAEASHLPQLVAYDPNFEDTPRFWSTLQVLARDGAPPAIAATVATRL